MRRLSGSTTTAKRENGRTKAKTFLLRDFLQLTACSREFCGYGINGETQMRCSGGI